MGQELDPPGALVSIQLGQVEMSRSRKGLSESKALGDLAQCLALSKLQMKKQPGEVKNPGQSHTTPKSELDFNDSSS